MASTEETKSIGSFGEVLEGRFKRRSLLSGLAKVVPAAAFAGSVRQGKAEELNAARPTPAGVEDPVEKAAKDSRLQFSPISVCSPSIMSTPIRS